ncbi:MAG: haloacid dehalogenase-like hydrolase [Methylococcales bacterium]|nr:haloacid dehalogenase-like hydrolase [Methylococcales bacterium]
MNHLHKIINKKACVVIVFGCVFSGNVFSQIPLKSWNKTQVKSEIIEFVTRTTDPKNKDYVKIKDRIATFDNDGTLWSEQPFYFQFFFALDQIKKLSSEHPEWKNKQPYKAAIEDDLDSLSKLQSNDLLKIVLSVHSNNNSEKFEQLVKNWMKNSSHPKFKRPYNQLIFQPMLELINYLKENDYKVFIVSGGSVEFIRAWGEETYGIPKNQIIGSSLKGEFRQSNNDNARVAKLAEIDFIDDHKGKPIAIEKFIGRRPVISVGNSDGDLEMMQYTASGKGARLMLYLHHTDSEREWEYDKDSLVGKLDKGLDEAKKSGWSVIDMKKDWKIVYPFNDVEKDTNVKKVQM